MRWRILSVIGMLYAVQFIPATFTLMTVPIVLRKEGHSATTIGFVMLAGTPYILKFLWAPLIDKYRLGRDRYKSWIVALSSLHVAALLVLAFLDPSGPVIPLFIVLFIALAAVSTQDVAVDALAISLTHREERTMGASFQNLGIYLGAIVGGFGFLHLYDRIGWTVALLAQAAIFTAPLLMLVLVQEPARPRSAPKVTFRNALRFFVQPRIRPWLAILCTMRLPLALITLPLRMMMVDQGMSTEEIALWFGLLAMSAAGGSSLIIGPLIRRLPRVSALYLVGLINIAVLITACILAATLPGGVRVSIIIAWAAIAIADVALYGGAMDKVRPQIPGFDFTMQVAIMSFLPILMNPVSGNIYDNQGYLPVFATAVLLGFVPLAILYFWFGPFGTSAVGLDGEQVVSTGTITTDSAAKILDVCEVELAEHGITCSRPGPDCLLMEEMGCKVEMKALEGAIDIRIETPTDNFMTFIRDEIVEHVGEIDPKAIEEMRWTGGIRVGELPSNFRILRATRRQGIFPGLIRVTLSGIDVEALTRDGIHIKVMMPEERGRTPVWPVIAENGGISWPQGQDKLHARFVTIRQIRLHEREIDVDVAHHDGGLISNWAALEGDEQEVGVMGPGGDPHLPSTDNVVLAADYTGLPAVARLIENVDGRVTGYLFAAAPSQEALEAYLPPSNRKVTAVEPAVFSEQVADMIRNCTNEPVSYAWFAGEFNAAQTVRSIFKGQFGLSGKTQNSMAYWREGVPADGARVG
ncbi:MAG: hypothetical protein CSA84_04605 [Actinomycetales bacterium]|nr:MAG: hypothetical protein CSA84_04605 [Actinomycetales bacterium]